MDDEMRPAARAWLRFGDPIPTVIEQAEPGGVICTTERLARLVVDVEQRESGFWV